MIDKRIASCAEAVSCITEGSTVMIATVVGPAAVATFVITRTVPNLLRQITGILNAALLPELTGMHARGDFEPLRAAHIPLHLRGRGGRHLRRPFYGGPQGGLEAAFHQLGDAVADKAVDLGQRHRRRAAFLQQGQRRRVQVRCAVDQRAVEVEYDRADHRNLP